MPHEDVLSLVPVETFINPEPPLSVIEVEAAVGSSLSSGLGFSIWHNGDFLFFSRVVMSYFFLFFLHFIHLVMVHFLVYAYVSLLPFNFDLFLLLLTETLTFIV